MAFDGFLKIKGIDGESTDTKHQGWIEIGDCNMEILQSISATASSAGGASAERADFSDFCFTKLLDKASPQLAQACAKGTHFDMVAVELCRQRENQVYGDQDERCPDQPHRHERRRRLSQRNHPPELRQDSMDLHPAKPPGRQRHGQRGCWLGPAQEPSGLKWSRSRNFRLTVAAPINSGSVSESVSNLNSEP
jgi:hypothetical protein